MDKVIARTRVMGRDLGRTLAFVAQAAVLIGGGLFLLTLAVHG